MTTFLLTCAAVALAGVLAIIVYVLALKYMRWD